MFPEDEYQLEFFRAEGFVRRVCESCGGRFWTRDIYRRTCGDPPCDPYSFIGTPVFREMDLDSMRDHYLRFFEAQGHTRVPRYPVVARWRDDIYLTIASIADFQPFVTSGQVPPPANPLTISQPCIRLDDLDSVGRSGRHLTTFEMMAHHVFNTKEHEIYWKDRTVELCDELLLGLGVNPESITYKESPWAGGGNAGPSLEVLVGGLELATLVFMNLRLDPRGEYVIKGERYTRMDNYIVDTGYGLERFVWASKGSPTIYDAVFPDVVKSLSEMAGVEHDLQDPEYAEIFARNARLAGMIDLGEASLRDLRKRIAESIKTTPDRLERIMAPMERIYAIADHTRCLAYMLGDGIIPSNVKAGYLARLVIRRTLRMMRDLKLEIPLSEIVEMQISRLDYPDWKERMETISEILSLEEQRYAETLEKGSRMVSKIASHYSKKGGRIPLTELVSLYDTHGIPPEIAKETAGALGVDVELPDNFYSIVASTHSRAEQCEVETRSPPFEKTERLFYHRPFDQEFDATVLGIFEGSVVLDRTLFYPEGGGQPADHGVLERGGQIFNVTDVQMIEGVVLHRVEPEGLLPGDRVTGRIDMRRRMAHARHHTATHIINDSAKRILGRHVWQAGAQKSEDRARLDISHYRRISEQEMKAIELEANRRVMEMIPVITEFMPREQAERLFGFQLYQGGVPPGREIRVVRVGSDIEACAGTHVTNTGMIGPIKILRTERVQDGVERIEFAAGEAAVQRIQERDDILAESASILRVPIEQLPRTVSRFFEEWKDQQKEIEHLKEEIARLRILTLSAEAVDVNGVRIVARDLEEADGETLLKAATMLSESDMVAILGGASGGSAKVVVSVGRSGIERGLNAADIVRAAARYIGGGGGGKPDLAQGGGPNVGGLKAAIDAGLSAARKSLQG
ncbi:MAG: alanine--tRNA ligase [Methanothrix sp.]|nr:alanine--tRNA ligase [Methanothrix sp.]MCX8207017.1 alanine--tRNA ligase [Methanothrix sp.]